MSSYSCGDTLRPHKESRPVVLKEKTAVSMAKSMASRVEKALYSLYIFIIFDEEAYCCFRLVTVNLAVTVIILANNYF